MRGKELSKFSFSLDMIPARLQKLFKLHMGGDQAPKASLPGNYCRTCVSQISIRDFDEEGNSSCLIMLRSFFLLFSLPQKGQ